MTTRVEPGEIYEDTQKGTWWFADFPGEGMCVWSGTDAVIGDRTVFDVGEERPLRHVPSAEVPDHISVITAMASMNTKGGCNAD